MKNTFYLLTLLTCSLLISACGGGGGGGGKPGAAGNQISGVASKGIIAHGTVRAYALAEDGTVGSLLDETTTDENGEYLLDLGNYLGALLVEAFGPYIDEATGLPMDVPAEAPLRAMVPRSGGNLHVPVTPLTELAVRQAEAAGGLTETYHSAAARLLSGLFKIDVLASYPVAPTEEAMNLAGAEQRAYTLALAALSQLMAERGMSLEDVHQELAADLADDGKLTAEAVEGFVAGLANFLASPENKTGVHQLEDSALAAMGHTPVTLELSAVAASEAPGIGAIELTVIFPAGAALDTDARGNPLEGAVRLSEPAAVNSFLEYNHLPATDSAPASLTLAIINTGSLPAGELIEIDCQTLGAEQGSADDFTLVDVAIYDEGGSLLDNLDVAASLIER